jgi:hypothetical protein
LGGVQCAGSSLPEMPRRPGRVSVVSSPVGTWVGRTLKLGFLRKFILKKVFLILISFAFHQSTVLALYKASLEYAGVLKNLIQLYTPPNKKK